MKNFILPAALAALFPHCFVRAAQEPIINLEEVSEIMGFPKSELVVADESESEKMLYGDLVFHACKVTSKTPFSFYPVVISLGAEGTFLTKRAKQQLAYWDSIPGGPLGPEGRGFLGSLPIQKNAAGGILFQQVPVLRIGASFDTPILRPAIVAVSTDHVEKTDVQISIHEPFSTGEALVRIPGGDAYYRMLSFSDEGATGKGDRTAESEFKQMVLLLTLHVHAKLVESGSSGGSGTVTRQLPPMPQSVDLEESRISRPINHPPPAESFPAWLGRSVWIIVPAFIMLIFSAWRIFRRGRFSKRRGLE